VCARQVHQNCTQSSNCGTFGCICVMRWVVVNGRWPRIGRMARRRAIHFAHYPRYRRILPQLTHQWTIKSRIERFVLHSYFSLGHCCYCRHGHFSSHLPHMTASGSSSASHYVLGQETRLALALGSVHDIVVVKCMIMSSGRETKGDDIAFSDLFRSTRRRVGHSPMGMTG